MRLALVTAYPPSKVTLNEYGYHLVKNFVIQDEISELILLSDYTKDKKTVDFEDFKKLNIKECWKFNSYFNLISIVQQVRKSKP
ncbi:MAG: glycosyl transferase family 1, partial [Flavobacterium sp.]